MNQKYFLGPLTKPTDSVLPHCSSIHKFTSIEYFWKYLMDWQREDRRKYGTIDAAKYICLSNWIEVNNL